MTEPLWAYFDTSTLVKRYVKEEGFSEAQRLLRRHKFLSSAIAPVELLSALTRRFGQKEISERNYTAILGRIKQDRPFWELVEITPPVLARAEEMVVNVKVRALDAVHLASALVFQEFSGRAIPFITSDERQFSGAERCGFEVIRVG